MTTRQILREWLDSFAPYVTALIAVGSLLWHKVHKVQVSINHRFDQFLKLANESGFAAGVKHEQDEQN